MFAAGKVVDPSGTYCLNSEARMIYPPAEPRNCPVCGTVITVRFVRLKNVPVNCSALWESAEKARAASRGDIELAFCGKCGMIFNGAFDADRVEYGLTYDNTLAYSPTFRAYAADLAERLIKEHDLRDKSIVEIGCGDGDFLNRLCSSQSGNRGMGFDPSAEERHLSNRLTIRSHLFRGTEVKDVDFVCCRHVLEHLESPRELLNTVYRCLSQRGGSTYFEVPDARAVLNGPSTWDVIFPHCSYFTPLSLQYLFVECGFEVLSVESLYGGQFLGLNAKIGRGVSYSLNVKAMTTLARSVQRFEAKLRNDIEGWSRLIEYASVANRRVALWGAGAKGTTFLNSIPGANRIGAVVDLNPRKQGHFIPGTGQRIVPPEELTEYRPDIIILLNPLYEEEIQSRVAKLGLDPTLMLDPLLPIPTKDAIRLSASM